MRNFGIKYPFLLICMLSSIFGFMACNKGAGNPSTASGSNANSSLYIGARYANNQIGIVYKCDLDGNKCKEIHPNNILQKENIIFNFGSSLFAANNSLYIGGIISDHISPSKQVVFKCDLDGNNCKTIFNPSSFLDFQRAFGKTFFEKENSLYIGTNTSDSDSTIYKCDLDGNNCLSTVNIQETNFVNLIIKNESMYFLNRIQGLKGVVKKCSLNGTICSDIYDPIMENHHFGESLFVTDLAIYMGDERWNSSSGGILRCDLNGKNCSLTENPFPSDYVTYFGHSIFATDAALYIGANGTNNSSGIVDKCDLEGKNCVQIQNPNGTNKSDEFGTSIFVY